jgi:hypothetical protein
MIRKLKPSKHGGLNMSSPTETLIVEDNLLPVSPTGTCISSSTSGGSPLAKAPVDAKLDVLLELVRKTVVAKRELDKEETWLTQEQNTIKAEQAAIDERQEALDVRKRTFERRETTAKRAREAYLHDMQSIDRRLTNPDNDDEDDCAGDGLVGSTRNR